MIQGPNMQMLGPETVTVDGPHGEIIVGEDGGKDILVFRRDAKGDEAPLRIIRGPRTGLDEVRGVAVDPARNLIVVSSYSRKGTTGLFLFNRTDEGDTLPKAIIAGPKTGIVRIRQVEVDPDRGKIFVAVKNNVESYHFDAASPSPWDFQYLGLIGILGMT